jgi:hypothetical protein
MPLNLTTSTSLRFHSSRSIGATQLGQADRSGKPKQGMPEKGAISKKDPGGRCLSIIPLHRWSVFSRITRCQPRGIHQGQWTVMMRMETLTGSMHLLSQAVPRGKKQRLRSLTPEHPSKVPCQEAGLSSSIQMYRVQVPGGLATPIPTPASPMVQPSLVGPPPSPMGPSRSAPQQTTPVLVIGTATHPVDLDQSTLDQKLPVEDLEPPTIVPEQPTVDLDQYRWPFTTAKGERERDIDVGLARYKLATQTFWQACELQTVHMTGCINYLSDLAWYLGVGPKDLAEGVQTLKRQSKDALKAAAVGQRTQAEQG